MVKPAFNYNSLRAKKARLTVDFSILWRWVVWLLIVSFASLGVLLLVLENTVGWLSLALAIVPFLFYQYWRWELYRLDPDQRVGGVESVLSSSVLGRLGPNPSPRDLSKIIANTSSGLFILGRYGISAQMLSELASDNPGDIEIVWQQAIDTYQRIKSPTMSGGIIALALLKSHPSYQSILSHLRLDYEELEQGVIWHDFIYKNRQFDKKTLKTGGLARDWSFGYIPLLQNFGRPLGSQINIADYMISKDIDYYQQPLTQLIAGLDSSNRGLALIGPAGVGKDDIVHLLANELLYGSDLPSSLQYNQIIELDAGSLIAQSDSDAALEQIMIRIITEAHQAKNVILYFNKAQLFFEKDTGSIDLSKVLLPIIEAGTVKMILSFDKQRLLKIAQKQPNLVANLQKVNLNPPTEEQTMLILKDKILELEARNQVIYMYQTLKESYRLGNRYVHDQSMPKQALVLLEQAAAYADQRIVRFSAISQVIEQTSNIKLSANNDEDRKQKLLDLENLISQKLIGQKSAIKAVAGALRRAGASVRNQNRPIGSFLFLGSTGVGKTQLAKVLADIYFGGQDQIIRINLNEFVTDSDVDRLLAEAADNPYSLTAQISKKPFSVVLLDEIEKAHPAVLASLLQLLDEGILKDSSGREVSFQDAIIIATSNAGALKIKEYIKQDLELSKMERQFVDYLIENHYFRPEFLNRFDELVLFNPLSEFDLLQIVDLLLKEINQNLADQKITVNLTKEAKELLIKQGYDPEMGARPMRRTIQRTVENIVAKQIIGGQIGLDKKVEITADDITESLK